MSRRPRKFDDPRIVEFRPRPKPPRVPGRWQHSLKLFAIVLVGAAVLRAAFGSGNFDLYDLIFAVLLAGAIGFGDLVARRA